MERPSTTIKNLLERYVSNAASPEEVRQLIAYFREGGDVEAEVLNLMRERLEKPTVEAGQLTPEVQRALSESLDKIRQKIHQTTELPMERSSRGMRHAMLAAAASILLFFTIGLGWYYFNQEKGEDTSLVSAYGGDVRAGGDRATLTLSDGRVVELSSDKHGVVIGDALTYNDGTSVVDVAASGDPKPIELILTTPRGGQYQTTLSDGTKVWLNAGSSLKYPLHFSGEERVVTLEGEAYFDVSHDTKRPFTVKVNDTKIEVLGTQFNVNTYTSIVTTLIEGTVKVANATGQQLLKPGQEARVGESITIHRADIDKVMAWKNGYFHFKSDNITDIMAQLARWYDIEVKYEGNAPSKGYNGRIRREVNLSKVLDMLTYLSGGQFTIEDKQITVMFK